MTPEQRYEHLWLIHDELLRLPPERRQAHLEARCAGDPDQRAEVAALLAQDGAGGPALLDAPCPFNVKGLLRGGPHQPEAAPPAAPAAAATEHRGAAGTQWWAGSA